MSASNQAKKTKLPTDDENKSFVGQMATTMTRLLPNTITKWFSTTPNANGSTQMAESTDSSTEDESTDGPLQPPAKRMRYNLPGPSSLYTIPETRSISTNTEPTESNDHMANRSTYTLESDVETKACEETSAMKNKIEKSIYNLHDSLASPHQTTSGKRKALETSASLSQLNESYDREFGVLNEHKPFFRIGLAASSPFYRGNTKYGGTNNLYVNQPNIKSKKTTHVNNSMKDNEATMSNSAKRIMDLLDNFSSPTVEARRIPQITNISENNKSNKSLNTSTVSKRHLGFQNKELYVPSVASVLKLKERSRLMKTTSVARQIIASQSSSSDIYQTNVIKSDNPNASEGKFTSKIRSRVTKTNQNKMELEQTVTPVNLPTATLQIDKDNLPKFSFHINLPDSSSRSSEIDGSTPKTTEPNKEMVSSSDLGVMSTKKEISKVTTNTPDTTDGSTFKFSSPVRICVDTLEDPISPQQFALCSPERNIEDMKQNKESIFGKKTTQSQNQITETPKLQLGKEQRNETKKVKKCTDCKIEMNDEQSEKCTDCVKVKQPEPLPIVVTSTKWRCGDCWVDNEEDKVKCVCCGGNKPSKTKLTGSDDKKEKADVNSKITAVSDTSDNKKLINNFSSSNVATSKPNSTLSHIVKQQSSKWECPNCMVRNENNTSKCVCCETEKPGTVKEASSKSFNFGISPNVSFKFGIDPKQNIPSKESNKSTVTMESQDKKTETNNNVFFGNKIEYKSAEIKSTEASTKSAELIKDSSDMPKATFSFGIPKKDNSTTTFVPTSSTPTFSFGVPKSLNKSETEKDDKTKTTTDAVFGIKPTNNTLSPITTNTVPNLNKPFTVPQADTSTTNESVVPKSTFSFSSSNFTPPKGLFDNQKSTSATTETTTTVTTNAIITSAQQSPSPSMSFFSNSNTTSGNQQNMFFKKTETSANLSLFPKSESSSPLFSKPESTTTSTTTTTLSLFSKPESTINTTAASQPLATNPPVFSFGNNVSQNAQQPTEKPKFTFTFGSNKSDAPTLFNAPSPFGSAVDKFNISYPNTIGSGLSGNNGISNSSMSNATMNTNSLNNNVMSNNTISSNIMGNNSLGNNTLTSNPIGGNIMGNNALGSNTMSSNTVGNSAMGSNSIGNSVLNSNILGNNSMNNNEISNNNGLTTGNPLAGLACGNGLSAGTGIGGDGLSNTLNPGNPLMVGASTTSPIGGNIFNRVQKKDMWSGSNAAGSSIFASNTATNTAQKPASFTFGGSTSFNSNNSAPTPAFGSPAPQQQPQPAQVQQAVQPTSNIFGNTSNNQPLFANTVPNQPAQPSVFGAAHPAVPSMGPFGAPGFGAPNTTFENVSMNPTQPPAFNFGASNNQPSIFGFTQRPQMQQTTGVYNFGSPAGTSAPQVQFNMGSAPVTGRRVRKVIRRTTAR